MGVRFRIVTLNPRRVKTMPVKRPPREPPTMTTFFDLGFAILGCGCGCVVLSEGSKKFDVSIFLNDDLCTYIYMLNHLVRIHHQSEPCKAPLVVNTSLI
jgi:hypothetical protein